jgi:hypothetical protein
LAHAKPGRRAFYGYSAAPALVQVLRQCDDLSRDNITNIKDFTRLSRGGEVARIRRSPAEARGWAIARFDTG